MLDEELGAEDRLAEQINLLERDLTAATSPEAVKARRDRIAGERAARIEGEAAAERARSANKDAWLSGEKAAASRGSRMAPHRNADNALSG